MTEKEMLETAIHCLSVQAEQEVCEECKLYNIGHFACKEATQHAIKALKEIQEYREIGTVENLKTWCSLFGLDAFDELAQYRKIGTLEECRSAIENQMKKQKGGQEQ